MNIIKCSSIVKVIKNFRKSITNNVNITEITNCLDELVWTINNKRVLFTTKDVSVYLLYTLFIIKNVVQKNYFLNVQDNLHKTMCQLVSILIDSILLLTLNNKNNEFEIASQISMIIETYIYGFHNTLTVFRNIEHLSDQLMATNHRNVLDILKQRFPKCFGNPVDLLTQEDNTSDDLNRHFSDQLSYSSYEILTMDERNNHQTTVPEFNMSYDELIMYMAESYDDKPDIPWLISFQIRTQSKMITKKKRSLESQDDIFTVLRKLHTFSCSPCHVQLSDISVHPTKNVIKRRMTIDCSKMLESQVNNERTSGFEQPKKKKTIEKPKDYCWECHLPIEMTTQYCCLTCSRSYHKNCFRTDDLVCLDCVMAARMENQDPESLALILSNTMKKVLRSESGYRFRKIKTVNFFDISLKVDNKQYTCLPDFLSDVKMILHTCSIKKRLSGLKEHAEKIMEIVLQDLKLAICRNRLVAESSAHLKELH